MSSIRRLAQALLFLSSLPSFACSDPAFDTTRKTDQRGTLGEEIYKLLYKDLHATDDRRAQGFQLEHDDFVGAVDHIFPPNELSYTQSFLVKLLPLYDNGTIPGATRMLAASLDRLSKDQEALRSLAAIDHRIGYVDRAHEEALVRRIAHFHDYQALVKQILRLVLEHDGLDDQGNPDPSENDSLSRLTSSLAERLRTLEISDDAERQIVLLTDLLMSEDPKFASDASSPPPSAPARGGVVARDQRGMARVSLVNGQVVAPFTDTNPHDGLADVNVLGQYVDANGMPIDIPPFGQVQAGSTGVMRDDMGRAVAPGGGFVYQYVGVDKTMMAGLLRDGRQLIADGVPMKAVRTLDTVLGQRASDGTYAPDNGILDMAHAVGASANIQELPALLELFRKLLSDHEATVSWVDLETKSMLDISDNYNVALRPGNTFFGDIMSVLRKILRVPGLAEDMLTAIEDPAFANVGPVQVSLMSFRKEPITMDIVTSNTMFDTPVDRTMPDVRGNQSIMMRTLHLTHDTKGASYQPSFIGIPLGFIFKIDDLAEFYFESIIGKTSVPALVSMLTGLPQTPTPQDLAAFINKDQMFGNPKGNEGIDVKDNDGDSLYAVSYGGMSDVLKPLIQVFYDHGQMDLLFELFEVLYQHWPSAQSGDYQHMDPSMPRYAQCSGIRNYEPMMIDQWQHAKTVDSTRRLLSETDNLILSNNQTAHDLLLLFARKFFDTDGSLKARDGRHEVDFNGERVTPLSPFDLVRAARARLKNTVKKTAMSQSDWDSLIDALNRTLLEVERTGPDTGHLKNPRALPVANYVLSFLQDRAQKHAMLGDSTRWVTQQLEQNVQDAVTSKDLPAIFDVIYTIDGDKDLSAQLIALRDELLAEDQGFQDMLVVSADALQSAKDASIGVGILKFIGQEIDPSKKLLFTLTSLTQKSIDIDADQHMLEVIKRSLDDAPQGGLFAEGLGHAIRQPNRVNPLSNDIVTGDDILKITDVITKYMLDDQHGVEKFYDLIAKRK